MKFKQKTTPLWCSLTTCKSYTKFIKNHLNLNPCKECSLNAENPIIHREVVFEEIPNEET